MGETDGILQMTGKFDDLYAVYLGDYVYYHTLYPILQNTQMKDFENQIVGKEGKDSQYYRRYQSMEKWNPDENGIYIDRESDTVLNIMEIAMIAWLDLIWQNNDRFAWPDDLK